MCYEEFIAYQCGHRSMGVVRTCPMTTAGHNFPICETMCTPCERQLHSRWVLIREWEHRWLHERGACGCEVIFPGLLTTPRVIGHKSALESPASATGSAYDMATAERNDTASNSNETVESSKDSQAETGKGGSETTATASAAGHIPALFAEGVTETGEHRVAVRLPSLYAAEWKADHAALHKAGKCTCAATFAPYQPQVSDEELTAHDRDNLTQWRQREMEGGKGDDSRSIEAQVDETMQRVAEIKKTFGEFEVEEEKPPKVKLPRLPPPATAEHQTVKVRGQNQGNNNTRHFNRRAENRRERNLPSHPQFQTTRRPSTSPQSQGQLIVSSQAPSPPYPLPANQPSTQATASAVAMPMPTPIPTGYHYPEYPHHQHPHYPVPAHPTYATATTYNNEIPAGAFPWASAPQATPGMPWLTQGPGPYRTPGLAHNRSGGSSSQTDSGVGTGHGGGGGGGGGQAGYAPYSHYHPHPHNHTHLPGYAQGYAQAHGHGRGYPTRPRHHRHHGGGGERQLAVLEQSGGAGQEVEDDRGRGGWRAVDSHTQQQHHGNTAGRPEFLQPICGLPIAAGPEGTSHMPDWLGCPLRRSVSVGAALVTGGGGGGVEGEVGVGVGSGSGEEGVEGEAQGTGGEDGRVVRRAVEQDEGREREDGKSDRLLTPPPLPTRRHSAAT
ncbi:hypothetical protein B0I37DRAFT_421559 [Chaetomium sp. MPI-CAGE-AT-0009]|nr:hypothetical protein B0I37DRAFT_421559 [Chaetomium sp. MPI-CAGE-AT-0009]